MSNSSKQFLDTGFIGEGGGLQGRRRDLRRLLFIHCSFVATMNFVRRSGGEGGVTSRVLTLFFPQDFVIEKLFES